jgi:hypothetical protein
MQLFYFKQIFNALLAHYEKILIKTEPFKSLAKTQTLKKPFAAK